MSGGSWDYVYSQFESVAYRLKSTSLEHDTCELRRALGDKIAQIARALHAIEWVDSCDYANGDEKELIAACFIDPKTTRAEQIGKVLDLLEDRVRKLKEEV